MDNRGDRGIVLVAVLWVLVLLGFLVASFSLNTRTETLLARNLVENAKAEALADGAIYRAIAGLRRAGEEGAMRADGTVYRWALGEGEVVFFAYNEAGKVDLNQASPEVLRALFEGIGVSARGARALADAVVDFRDQDSTPEPNGAEEQEYRAAGLPHGPKNGRFILVEEVQQVLGMTGPIYTLAAPLLTLYAGSTVPDPDLAPPAVQAALANLSPGFAEREQGPGQRPSSFGFSFSGAEGAQEEDAFVEAPPLGGEEEGSEGGGFGGMGGTYSIHAEARTAGGAVYARDVVVTFEGDGTRPFDFLVWRRGPVVLFPPDDAG